MAGQKPNTFTVASSFPAGMEYYFQDSSNDEFRIPHALLITQLETDGFVKQPASESRSNSQTISIPAGRELQSIIIKAAGTPTITVVSSLGNTLIDAYVFASPGTQVFKPFEFFESAGTITFTISSGSVTVWVKYL